MHIISEQGSERATNDSGKIIAFDGGETFRVEPFLEPSVEKSVGTNAIPADRLPAVLYFDGSREYPGGGDYYDQNHTVAEILASGGYRTNNVILEGL